MILLTYGRCTVLESQTRSKSKVVPVIALQSTVISSHFVAGLICILCGGDDRFRYSADSIGIHVRWSNDGSMIVHTI